MTQLYKTFTIAEIAHIRKLKFDVGRAEHYEVLERNKKNRNFRDHYTCKRKQRLISAAQFSVWKQTNGSQTVDNDVLRNMM